MREGGEQIPNSKPTLGTVGASSSVTRRVLSENVDVIYDISVMFQPVELIQKCG